MRFLSFLQPYGFPVFFWFLFLFLTIHSFSTCIFICCYLIYAYPPRAWRKKMIHELQLATSDADEELGRPSTLVSSPLSPSSPLSSPKLASFPRSKSRSTSSLEKASSGVSTTKKKSLDNRIIEKIILTCCVFTFFMQNNKNTLFPVSFIIFKTSAAEITGPLVCFVEGSITPRGSTDEGWAGGEECWYKRARELTMPLCSLEEKLSH